MKSDIEIKDDIYNFLKESELVKEVTGKLCKRSKRPVDSDKEDIIISVLSSKNGGIQTAFVNVNIYVADDLINGQYEESTIRCRQLCDISKRVLESVHLEDCWIKLDSQRVLEVDATNEHVINNKLFYQLNTE
jgi:hypothetical protein